MELARFLVQYLEQVEILLHIISSACQSVHLCEMDWHYGSIVQDIVSEEILDEVL